VADKSLLFVSRAVLPFLLIQIALLFVFTYWADLVLLLPRLVYNYGG